MYNSMIWEYNHEGTFCKGWLPHKIHENIVLQKLEHIRCLVYCASCTLWIQLFLYNKMLVTQWPGDDLCFCGTNDSHHCGEIHGHSLYGVYHHCNSWFSIASVQYCPHKIIHYCMSSTVLAFHTILSDLCYTGECYTTHNKFGITGQVSVRKGGRQKEGGGWALSGSGQVSWIYDMRFVILCNHLSVYDNIIYWFPFTLL